MRNNLNEDEHESEGQRRKATDRKIERKKKRDGNLIPNCYVFIGI